jgi:hypothetical protein
MRRELSRRGTLDPVDPLAGTDQPEVFAGSALHRGWVVAKRLHLA